MPEWKPEWEGETLFFDADSEILQAVPPRPNRAVFFDSRIVHAGHAPGRTCSALRVAVAFKLEPAALSELPGLDATKKRSAGTSRRRLRQAIVQTPETCSCG